MRRDFIRRNRRIVLAAVLLAVGSLAITDTTDAGQKLQIQVVGSDGSTVIGGVRVYVESASGQFFPVVAEGSALKPSEFKALVYDKKAGPESIEHHTTVTPAQCAADLPDGTYTIRVERGHEWRPVERSVTIAGRPASVTIALSRWINMNDQRFYSGDVHLHVSEDETKNLIEAEDLNVAFPLSHWVTASDTSAVTGNLVPGEWMRRFAGPNADSPTDPVIVADSPHSICPRVAGSFRCARQTAASEKSRSSVLH